MVENRSLAAIRRALAGLPGTDALLCAQAGLIVNLCRAATGLGEELADIASALAIGMLEAKQMHETGQGQKYEHSHLSVLRAAAVLNVRHKAGKFFCGRSAEAATSFDDESIFIAEAVDCLDPFRIVSGREEVLQLDPLVASSFLEEDNLEADLEAITTAQVAAASGITLRAARYRKARQRAAGQASGQRDLFGGA